MRKGNSSYDRSQASHNPDRSYDVASWIDYVLWLERCNYSAVSYLRGQGITCITPSGDMKVFENKKDIYVHLLEEDGEKYV